DYVAGPLFVADLYRRGGGSWRLVNRALRDPPRLSSYILQPRSWPRRSASSPIRLRGARPAGRRWRLLGGGEAGEQMLLGLLAAGAPAEVAQGAAAGWRNGRFALWRRSASDCPLGCPTDTTGILAVRLRDHAWVARIANAYFDYALL